MAMLHNLEVTHNAGYIYNDLKLDNLLVGFREPVKKPAPDRDVFKDCSIHLVDFGYASKFSDKKGNHIK